MIMFTIDMVCQLLSLFSIYKKENVGKLVVSSDVRTNKHAIFFKHGKMIDLKF